MRLDLYQKRVVVDQSGLDDKRARLARYMKSERFHLEDPAEQDRLRRQSKHMEDYSKVLGERIEAFLPQD